MVYPIITEYYFKNFLRYLETILSTESDKQTDSQKTHIQLSKVLILNLCPFCKKINVIFILFCVR